MQGMHAAKWSVTGTDKWLNTETTQLKNMYKRDLQMMQSLIQTIFARRQRRRRYVLV